MREKTIKAVLNKKFNDFLDSIEDINTRNLVKKNSIITGGALTSMLLNEEVNDYDIYFTNKETVKAVCEYYCKKFNEAHLGMVNKLGIGVKAWVLDGSDVDAWKNGKKPLTSFADGYKTDITYQETDADGRILVSRMISNTTPERIKIMINSDGVAEDEEHEDQEVSDFIAMDEPELLGEMDEIPNTVLNSLDSELETKTEKGKYRPIFLTTNAITLSNKVQLITRFYGEPDKIHENFDFIHCQCYWTSGNNNLVLTKEALESILNKQLIYNGSKYPFCSIVRTRKFIKRGWNIDAGQYLKMSFQLSELDLSDVDVLEDQLVGVDTLYFKGVIQALQKMKDKNSDFRLTNSYVTTIVDKVFN